MKVLIIYLDSQHSSTIYPCIHAANELTLADALIFGKTDIKDISGIENITHYPELTHARVEDIAPIIQEYSSHYTHILLHSDNIGISYGSYLSGYLNIPSLMQITHIVSRDTYQCSGHLIQLKNNQQILGISGLFFRKSIPGKPTITSIHTKASATQPKMSQPKAVIGLGDGASTTIKPLQKLAKQLNTDIYGSKPIIDKQYLKPSQLLGVSGKSIHTPLYIAMGILGDDYHMLGVQSSLIIAINPDHNAPIFKVADYGYIGNIQGILPLLQKYKLCLDIIP